MRTKFATLLFGTLSSAFLYCCADSPRVASFKIPAKATTVESIELSGEDQQHSFDLGDVLFEERLVVKLPVINRTGGVMNIQNITASCGCLGVVSDTLSISPGETQLLIAEIKLSKHGRFSKSLRVIFEDATCSFELTGQSRLAFEVSPSSVALTPGGQPQAIQITSFNKMGKVTVASPHPLLKLQRVTGGKPDALATYHCELSGDWPVNCGSKFTAPIHISNQRRTYTYSLQVTNPDHFEVVTKSAVGQIAEGGFQARLVIQASEKMADSLCCRGVGLGDGEDVTIIKSRRSGLYVLYTLKINVESGRHESLIVEFADKESGRSMASANVSLSASSF